MTRGDAQIPVACSPNAVPKAQRERWMELGKQFYAAVEELREVRNGYACRLPGDAGTVLRAAEYITLDRLCCRFVRWELLVEPDGGSVWLHITGPEGTKEFTRSVLETTDLVRVAVLEAAGIHSRERRAPEQVVDELR